MIWLAAPFLALGVFWWLVDGPRSQRRDAARLEQRVRVLLELVAAHRPTEPGTRAWAEAYLDWAAPTDAELDALAARVQTLATRLGLAVPVEKGRVGLIRRRVLIERGQEAQRAFESALELQVRTEESEKAAVPIIQRARTAFR